MNIQQNISLKHYNTFGIDVNAKRFVTVNSIQELKEIIGSNKDILLLSGGSNMLLTKDIDRLVVHLNLKGIVINDTEKEVVFVSAEAGENWHDFVLWCISQNYGGLENLSLIPGNVGTSPIQNIGAYGVEIKDTFYQLEALEISKEVDVLIQQKVSGMSEIKQKKDQWLKNMIEIDGIVHDHSNCNHNHSRATYSVTDEEMIAVQRSWKESIIHIKNDILAHEK